MKKKSNLYFTRSLTAVILLICVLGTLGLHQINVNAASSDYVYVAGEFNYSSPKQLIDNINRDRTSGGAFYYDINGKEVPATGLKALVYDNSLEKVAEQRAAELVVSYSNTRPTQETFTTCTYDTMSSNQEYIFKDTKVESGDYMYQTVWFSYGHGGAAASMMYPYFQSVAAACFTYDGTTYWVLEFSVNTSNRTFSTSNVSARGSKKVEFDGSKFTPIYKLTGGQSSYESAVGDNVRLQSFTLESYRGNALDETITSIEAGGRFSFVVTASDSSVTITNKSVVCATKLGTFTLTISIKDGSKTIASKKVTLKSKSNSMANVEQNGAPSVTYTGSAIKDVNLDLQYNGIKLTKGSDYTIIGARNNTNVTDTAYVTVKGTDNGRFPGTKEFRFMISPKSISGATVSCTQNGTEYTGKEITPSFSVKLGDKTLTTNDYYVTVSTVKNPGTYDVKIQGKGNYTGDIKYQLTVNKYTIKDNDVSIISDQTYTGKSIVPSVTVKANGYTLTANTDYTVTYSNNTNPGTATVTIVMQGNYYTGKITRTFKINKYAVKDIEVPQLSNQIYNGNQITPAFTIDINGKTLQKNIDYKVEYKNNVNVGTATATITMQGNYTGSFTRNFTIIPYEVSDSQISKTLSSFTYSGEPCTPDIAIRVSYLTLTKDTDYTLEYTNNIKAGTATVTINMIGNYSGTFTRQFKIKQCSILSTTVSSIPDQEYTGNEIRPSLTVTLNDKVLTEGTDYELTYKNNVKSGRASITIQGLDCFSNQHTVYFNIIDTSTPTPTPSKAPTSTPSSTPSKAPSPSATPVATPSKVPTSTPYTTPVPTSQPNSGNNFVGENTTNTTPTSSPVEPTSAPVPTKAPELDVGAFVKRCYEVALSREADEEGFGYWKDGLTNGQACGAQVGYGFIFSPEYIQNNTTNECFVTDLYLMFFDREPDQTGYEYWVNMLNSNEASREVVFAGFANSIEFYNLCLKYGVVAGYYLVGVPNDQQGGINSFVARMYEVCLGRLPDQGGQAGWVIKLHSGEVTGSTCAYGFVFSTEFIEMELSNEDFISYMYRAFFGREADEEGLAYWADQLKSGTASRLDIFNGFTGSIEFDALCQSYGIQR